MKTALIVGATGLVGKQLLQLILQDDRYSSVKVLVRKELNFIHPKLIPLVIDFDRMSESYDQIYADDVFCCLGTTMKQAGSKDAFKKVDFDYPVEIARITKSHMAKQYFLISALGADKYSSIYYNKIKGQTEEAIIKTGFDTLHILRPSLLLGDRTENRSGEDAAKLFYKIFGWLIPAKYQAIHSAKVARAMIALAKKNTKGVFIHESKELQEY